MKKIAIIFNGGTISMKVDPRINAAIPALSSEEIMSMVTNIEKYAEIETFNFSTLPGPHVSPKIMLKLSNYIKDILKREDIDGVIVTHGTDTLEETAFFLELNIKSVKPIIVVGDM
ncbi:MAG: asparaginase domain-containing protein, partial [Senegalia sp. (in: firmicutes)]